jgi:capsular polysaccharide biosynthesis protein
MDCTNTFRSLNNHLHTTYEEICEDTSDCYSVRRPGIPCSSKVKQKLQTIFTFSDAMFEDHLANYKPHRVIQKQIGKTGFTIIYLAYKWNYSYFHFLTEALPSMLTIQRSEPIVCLPSSFCVPILRWFGINNMVIHVLPPRTKEVVIQEFIEWGNPSPQKIQLLRAVIEEKVTFEKKIGILIFRKENYRKVLNHDEVLQLLKCRYPEIEWKVFDTLTIDETAQLFSKACVIVGPHGAGLTNMIFAPKGIDIIEFMDADNPNVCYWHLSAMLENRYHMIECTSINQNFTIPLDCALPKLQ